LLRICSDFAAISHRFLAFCRNAPGIMAKRRGARAPGTRQAVDRKGVFAVDKVFRQCL